MIREPEIIYHITNNEMNSPDCKEYPKNIEYIEKLKGTIDSVVERNLSPGFFGVFRFTVLVQAGVIQNIKHQVEQTEKI